MDGPSPAGHSLLARPFALATRVILAFPVAALAISIGLAIACMVYTGARLGYRTSRLDLLNPKSDYNRLWIEYIKEFGDEDDAVVVVEGSGREQVVPVLEELSAALAKEDRLFHAVLHEVDLRKVRSKGLHYLSPEELLGVEQFVNEVGPIVAGDWSPLNVGNMAGGMCLRLQAALKQGDPAQSKAVPEDLERFSASLLESLGQTRRYRSPWPEMPQSFAILSELNSEYLLTKQGQLGFVLLRLAPGSDTFARGSEATDALRDLIAHTQMRHPDTKIGLTGLPIMENDEMRSSEASMFWASALSMVGVALLFVAGFGGVRHALLANLILLIGMAWAFAYATVSVGHLNILSVTFTATLIGIGIDYGVYYSARYLQLRREGYTCEKALIETSRNTGPAITTGALTTAVAFFAMAMTSFKGVSEMGLIAGGGILLCAVSELALLPAAIYLIDRSGWGVRMPEPLAVHKWIAPLMKIPRLTLVVSVIGSGALCTGLWALWYDHNLLNMQAQGLESVTLERKLLAECNQSVWYALSIADSRDELLARKAEFLKLGSVERTEEIVSLLPADHELKDPIIRRIQQRLQSLPERPPLIPVDRPEKLGQVLGKVQEMVLGFGREEKCSRQLELTRDLLRRMPLSDCYAQLTSFQQHMAGELLSRLHVLRSIANPEPPELTDLPASLVNRFVGHNGKYLLKIYGRGDIWDTQALSRFVKDVRSVDPHVTGNPLQAHEASLEMKKSYQDAAIYSFLVIMGVLMFEFRSVRLILLAALPLGVGMLQTFGLLGLLNIPLNPANLIALPLILGMGVDYGVHIVHEYRDQKGPYRMSPATAVAVLVDGLTTVVGYGALMIASHQGLQSLGRVLTLAVTCCLFSSMVMLPALLTWMTRNRPEVEEELIQQAQHETANYQPAEQEEAEEEDLTPRRAPGKHRRAA
jgi:hopanoid biosynthesis associated RND transporter like protein HpnN